MPLKDTGKTDALAKALSSLLADSYTLYLKTQNYHWNVTGPQFKSLHLQFEEQYTELAAAIDEIAERIRALGHTAPGSYAQFAELASIKEAGHNVPDGIQMVKNLAEDNIALAKTAYKVIEAAEKAGDEVSVDLGVGRSTVHEKTAWMLESIAA